MNIPPKYEDVVAKLDAALGREAELREELESIKASVDGYDSPEHAAQVADDMGHQCDALQQRLTVAEQRVDRLNSLTNYELIAIARTAALNSVHRYNYMPSLQDEAYAWEPHYWVIEAMRAALKPAAEGEGS